jgi:transposase
MRKRSSEEFKRETVRLAVHGGKTVRQVSEELGINYWTVQEWVKRYGKQEKEELVIKGLKMTPEEENKFLRKELADIAEERDILKKAIAVFSRKPKLNTLS